MGNGRIPSVPHLGFMYAETAQDHGAKEDCFIYCGVNAFWEGRSLQLPVIPGHMKWYRVAYTGKPQKECKKAEPFTGSAVRLKARSLIVLIAK